MTCVSMCRIKYVLYMTFRLNNLIEFQERIASCEDINTVQLEVNATNIRWRPL